MSSSRPEEAVATDWEASYASGRVPWRSAGIGDISRSFLAAAHPGSDLLEIGCGIGDDARDLIDFGFGYQGIDISPTAIALAAERLKGGHVKLAAADIFSWTSRRTYAVVYEKGVLQGLRGPERRQLLSHRIANLLQHEGLWVTVCGSADGYDRDMPRGAIYLTHLVEAVERDFEILQIIKGPYGVRKPGRDFNAWHGLFRRR